MQRANGHLPESIHRAIERKVAGWHLGMVTNGVYGAAEAFFWYHPCLPVDFDFQRRSGLLLPFGGHWD